ncbi:hypothetical protein JCM17960_17660 [Magnetospira thiophila]
MTLSQSSLFTRNVAVFQHYFPALWKSLSALAWVPEAGVPDNIALGDKKLYENGAVRDTQDQLAAYFADPDRFHLSNLEQLNVSPVFNRTMKDISDFWDARVPAAQRTEWPCCDTGYCFVFGLGLGHHIGPLLERTACQNLLIVEPLPQFILQSMTCIDWGALWESAVGRGQRIFLISGGTPDQNARQLLRFVALNGRTFLEGSYAYQHYPSWELTETHDQFKTRMRTTQAGVGFFEDELLTLENSGDNIMDRSFKIIGARPPLAQPLPVILVGSGPSLDQDLPKLKKLADRAIILSCGSALGILLKNGIRPDAHVENENTSPTVKNLTQWRDTYGFEDIALIASTGIPPTLTDLFDRVWFYFRPGLSCSRLFHNGIPALPSAAPLVANAAFDAALSLGFRELYLFGIDCGRRPNQAHHARDAAILEEGYNNFLPGMSSQRVEDSFHIPVPGNFGGRAETSWVHNSSRMNFQVGLAAFPEAQAFNCADGAQIPGCRPRAAATVDLPPPPRGKTDLFRALERTLPSVAPGTFLDPARLNSYAEAADNFPLLIADILGQARQTDHLFSQTEQRLRRSLFQRKDSLVGIWELVDTSFYNAFRAGAYLGCRIADQDLRRAFLLHFLDGFEAACRDMSAQARALYERLLAKAAPPA